jgi:hypothetical protein
MNIIGVNRLLKLKRTTKAGFILLVALVFAVSSFLFLDSPKAHAQTFLVTGTTWTVPVDWDSSNNTIEVIGGGGGAGGGFTDATGSGGGGGGGGGGGAYAKATNVSLTPGSTVSISVGAAGGSGVVNTAGTNGGDTYLCNATSGCSSLADSSVVVGAAGGSGGGSGSSSTGGAGGAGGLASSGVGTTLLNGGSGGTPPGPSGGAGSGGGGGGGSAGPNAAGNNGTTASSTTAGVGGQGDGTAGGTGGTGSGSNGNPGSEYDSTHGSGGGAAGGNGISRGTGSPGGTGGAYGAAGGGGGGNGSKNGTGAAGGGGNQGMIRVVYNYTAQTDYRWRLDDGSETTGTSLAAQDTAATVTNVTPVRLRVGLVNQGDATAYSYQLEYAPYSNGCGTWTAVPNAATTEPFNMYATANYTDQSASTNVASGPGVLTDPAGSTFASGKLVASPSTSTSSISLSGSKFTELEYAIQINNNATLPSYCFRVTNAGTPLEAYNNYPILNISYIPSTPTIYSVANGTTNASRLPVYQLRSLDYNSDYLQYNVETCPTNSWPCPGGGHTYNQSASQSCWDQQDAQSGTAFASSGVLANSSMAYCTVPISDILTPSTTYYMRAEAIDPGGSNTYSAYSSVVSYTTSSLEIQIKGGTNIIGGTQIGN